MTIMARTGNLLFTQTANGSKLRRRRKTVTPSLQTRGNRMIKDFAVTCLSVAITLH